MKKNKPFLKTCLKSNTHAWNFSNGRNNKGHITAWHRGGRHARLYRNIDLQRKYTHGIVIGLEYDPNRTAFLARVFNPDIQKNNYILAPTELEPGDIIRSDKGPLKSIYSDNGHSQKLRYINTGKLVYNLSLRANGHGQILRAPGACGKLIKKTQDLAEIKLKSGQYRWFSIDTIATLGVVSNSSKRFSQLKKAGQTRWIGRRPTVRGVAMNPIDHPHGGGEGKTSGGRPSVTPWGKPTKGKPTKRIRQQLKYNAKI
uniref:Ribosomal protein L2 n=1 Tax=Protohalopteris sp. TaxID=2843287 RepID=A0A8F0FD87_9PHAE|nr:ribosomal protein L2 [Protohalopteris sp.]